MLKFSKYERPETVEEALTLIQKSKGDRILGGGVWMRLQDRHIPQIIDISACGLDQIENVNWETGKPVEDGGNNAWSIGAMVSLHTLEMHKEFNRATCDVFRSAVKDIVGVQMRNSATVGGSVFARFGFSDILTAFLPLDCDVVLAGEGRVSLQEFARRTKYERDILTHIIVREVSDLSAAFACVRRSATDFSVLNVCAAQVDGSWRIAVGARPGRAVLVSNEATIKLDQAELTSSTKEGSKATSIEKAASYLPDDAVRALDTVCDAAGNLDFLTNLRGSAQYRKHLARELTKRAILEAAGLLAPPESSAPEPRPQSGINHTAGKQATADRDLHTIGGEA